MIRPLKGGLKLEGKKEVTLTPWTIARFDPPRRVRIPLEGTSPLVTLGQRVRLGEKISCGRHASVSGQVSEIGESIEIVSDGRDERVPGLGEERSGWENLEPSQVFEILSESGLIGTPSKSAGFNDSPCLNPALLEGVPIVVVLNGCESEPYLTSGHALMMSYPTEVLRGADLLRNALGAGELVVAVEDNKEEAAETLKSKLFFLSWSHVRVEVLPARYPQDSETLLVECLSPQRCLTPLRGQMKVVVIGVAEAFAIYEAVARQKPFYERAVTIGGECVTQPKNAWVRIGTPAEEAVKYGKGFLREPGRIVLGGPMRGRAIESLTEPLTKKDAGLLGIAKEVLNDGAVEPCIRCGLCVESCPVSISPALISLASEKNLFELAEAYGASSCIGCGNCSCVCPAKRPMLELVLRAGPRW